MNDKLRKKLKAVVEYLPPEDVLESIIDRLIAEGRIPPRDKWKDLKKREAHLEGS